MYFRVSCIRYTVYQICELKSSKNGMISTSSIGRQGDTTILLSNLEACSPLRG